jgi:hypothetical protein
VRFTILTSPGSDPGDARGRASAIVAVEDPAGVAAAARACNDPFVLLLAAGARPRSGAFGGLSSAGGARLGVLGGATHVQGARSFGWMLVPVTAGPLPFDLAPIAAPLEEAGVDARVRGPIDVVSPGMVLAARDLLLEPLPRDRVAAMVELCARAREAGRDVVCRPSFACDAPGDDLDDRGRAAALRELAERRPELSGTHRLPDGPRRVAVEREVRLPGGRRARVRGPFAPVSVLVHGTGAELAARRARELGPGVTARAVTDPIAALRDELRVRGERHVLLASAAAVPDRDGFAALVDALESAPYVAVAAPSAAALDGSCVLFAAARLPQHVEPAGATLAEAVGTVVDAARALRRAVRVPGLAAPPPRAPPRDRTATVVLAAASVPEILRLTATAVVESTRGDDELVAAVAAGATTTRRILAAFSQVRIVDDAVDPVLADAVNRAAGGARGELVVIVADDVLLSRGALDRMRAAFARVPALGAAFPAVPGAAGGEGVVDVEYGDIAQLHALAELRALERARELEPIDVAVSPVFAVAREAFAAVGGIDPAHGPTRRGIADLVTRLRSAGYGVVRCDDALVHRFDAALSHSPAAAADRQQPVPAADPAGIARGFDPARRIPFVRAAGEALAALAAVAIAVPVASPAELDRAGVFLAAAAAAFDAASPVRVHLLLDGTVTPAEAVARVRPVLAASGKPMDQTLAVRIERPADLGAWLGASQPGVRVVRAAGHDREALADLDAVEPRALSRLLETAPR